jgi:hypothetical protein
MPTLVACRTLAKRGKSLVPESRMLMDESSNCILDRSEETQLERVLAVLMLLICMIDKLCLLSMVDAAIACEMRAGERLCPVMPRH